MAPRGPFALLGALILCALASASFAAVWLACTSQTSGHFTYALDDPYIHLAIARNFAIHGVWGVTPYENSAASSSPLWIFLLSAVIRIGGDWPMWPLIFGILASLGATLLVYFRLLKGGVSVPIAVATTIAAFAAAPLHVLPFTGMEHSLQILLDVAFAFWVLDWSGAKRDASSARIAFALTAVMCLCRFESVFLVVVPFLVSAWRRDWRLSVALALGPALAIGGFGLFAHWMGMPLIPNSLVLKGNVPHTFSSWWFLNLYLNLRARSFTLFDLFLLTVLMGFALRMKRLRIGTLSLQVVIWTVVTACVLHAAFALIGIFYRYEGYLTVLMVVVSVLALRQLFVGTAAWNEVPVTTKQCLLTIAGVSAIQCGLSFIFWIYQLNANLIVSLYAIGLVTLFSMEIGKKTLGKLMRVVAGTLVPLAIYFMIRLRAVQATVDISAASRDIYSQQIQMARFVSRYYPTGRLVVNDIGAVSYFSQVHLFDLWGLATDSVRDLKLKDNWNTATMKQQFDAFRPDLIIAYPDWYRKNRKFPASMIPVATWTIPQVTAAARRVVEFWAPSPGGADRLRGQLREFQPSLPVQVEVKYLVAP